ncbi:MAG: aa3-type cytochrome c oxidase subunit IV [Proteobacteria bacterium]|nr:aa3-type cytochrome c oxidase subunit IV [Pseudomonadota bacterium]
MADHGEVEYATASGNDYPEHEGTYERFVQFSFLLTTLVITIVVGLAIGSVTHRWGTGIAVIMISPIAAGLGMITQSRLPSVVVLLLALAALALRT